MNLIPVNIWDDYLEDEDAQLGHLQETHAYVEHEAIAQPQQRAYLVWLLPHFQRLAPTARFEFVESPDPDDPMAGPELRILDLSHATRKEMVQQLRAAQLCYSPTHCFDIFSES